jgi:hypothetical protein
MFKKIRRWFARPQNPAGNVYYVRLNTNQGTLYKIGYTSKQSLIERMSYGDNGDEKLISRQFFFTFRDNTWDIEQTLLDHFDKHRAFGKYSKDPTLPLCGRGQSELFAFDILGIDDDLNRSSETDSQKSGSVSSNHEQEGCLMVIIGLVLSPFTLGASLFFVLGGASAFFSRKSPNPTLTETPTQPQHPPAIKEIIDSLTNNKPTKKVRSQTP